MKRFIAPTNIDSNVLKEGIYNLVDFGMLFNDKTYMVQNISKENDSYISVFDNNFNLLQFIKLLPQCAKYTLAALKSNYKIVILGDGDVYISLKV